ncbi:MAG: hypothetical protein GX288_09270 [Clostridiales bacterium]|nr:hypothetical protein [Clostridiales bacterium]
MKNCDYWKRFFNTGKIDDYLSYIACTREESSEELGIVSDIPMVQNKIKDKNNIKDIIDNSRSNI